VLGTESASVVICAPEFCTRRGKEWYIKRKGRNKYIEERKKKQTKFFSFVGKKLNENKINVNQLPYYLNLSLHSQAV
jgi:hypothetical protein